MLCGVSLLACAVVPSWPVALVTFALLGLGNGLVLVAENVLLQHVVPDAVKGRVFGFKGSLISTSFAAAGTRTTFAALGIGCVAVWAVVRGAWAAPQSSAP
ncbi:MAG TPA: hypothetical protein VF529_12840 [Solirubrobacteraceae bacterium]